MKLFTAFITVLFLTAIAHGVTPGVRLGELQLGGTACQLSDVGSIEVTIDEGKLQIPVAIVAKKPAQQSLTRGTCNFSLPVELEPKTRLVLSDSSVLGLVNLSKGSKSKVSVELFKAGGRGQILAEENSAEIKKLRKNFELNQQGEVIVLDCGESGIIRGNTSVVLQGTARATASVYLIQMDVKVVACE